MIVGDYVRTKDGYIRQLQAIMTGGYLHLEDFDCEYNYIIKSSPNIIDLLEKGDLVVDYTGNVYKVDYIYDGYVFTTFIGEDGITKTLTDYQIKSIVTKEMFANAEYRVETN